LFTVGIGVIDPLVFSFHKMKNMRYLTTFGGGKVLLTACNMVRAPTHLIATG